MSRETPSHAGLRKEMQRRIERTQPKKEKQEPSLLTEDLREFRRATQQILTPKTKEEIQEEVALLSII